jgi:hypothetical protein
MLGIIVKRFGLVVLVPLLLMSCGSRADLPLVPEGQGWVIDYHQSPDLVFDWDRDVIASGSIELLLGDGTRAVVNAKTDLMGLCQELLPAPAVAAPCWLQVGPAAEDGHIEWVVPLELRGDTGQPLTWNQDHSSYQFALVLGKRIADVQDQWIVFESGRVVARGPTEPVFSDCRSVGSLSEVVAKGYDTPEFFRALLDLDEGFVTELECWRSI